MTGSKLKNSIFPDKDEKLAELVGIILGDGNIYVHKRGKSTAYMVRITGNSVTDSEYLFGYVKPLCENIFGTPIKTYKHKKCKELFLILYSKTAVDFLISIGLKAGDKIQQQVSIPKWIFENDLFLKACIRGLVDTDGSIYELKPDWPGLWQICFTNKNERLLADFNEGLAKVGISSSRIYRYKNGKRTPKIYITKKSELSKFYKEIGFSNPKHRNKLQPRSVEG